MATLKKHRILILGVSGYLGSAIYKELHFLLPNIWNI